MKRRTSSPEYQFPHQDQEQINPVVRESGVLCRQINDALRAGDPSAARQHLSLLENLLGTLGESDPLAAIKTTEGVLEQLSDVDRDKKHQAPESAALASQIESLVEGLRARHTERMMQAAGPGYAQAWQLVKKWNPELSTIPAKFGDAGVASYSAGKPGKPEGVNLPHPENNTTTYEALRKQHPESIERIAEMLDIESSELTEETFQQFVLLHELGHAQDRRKHYPEGADGADTFRTEGRSQLNTLPHGPYAPSKLSNWLQSAPWETLQEAYPAFRGKTIERVLQEQAIAYRDLPKERYADTFAIQTIEKARQDPMLGWDP